MNEYQEALDNLKEPTDAWSSVQLQMAENYEEPIVYEHQEDIDVLQELVDKATPMLITKYEITGGLHDPVKVAYQCPNCKKHFNNVAIKKIKFCYHCGQAIKRSER